MKIVFNATGVARARTLSLVPEITEMKKEPKKTRRGRPPLPPELKMVRHLGLRLTARSSALLDVCLEIARTQASLSHVSVAAFFMGLLDNHAAELGLRVETDERGVPQRITRSGADNGGRPANDEVQL